MKKKHAFFIVAFFIVPFFSDAQTDKDSIMALFKNMVSKYHHTDYLSFKVAYTYKANSKLNKAIDTIQGKVMMNKEEYHSILGSTETIHNNKYNIILFKEDSLMYISNASVGKLATNPAAMLEAMLLKTKDVSITLTGKRKQPVIRLDFSNSNDYKSAIFSINEKKGFLSYVQYEVNSEQMRDDDATITSNKLPSAINWGIVECIYSDYEMGEFDDSEFDDKKYFIKKGTEFKPTEAYKQYKIFLASPGL